MEGRILRRAPLAAVVALALVTALAGPAAARGTRSRRAPAAPTQAPVEEPLARDKQSIKSALVVDLKRDFARLPLHRATVDGGTAWYVVTEVSDAGLAEELGINFAPKLSTLVTKDCPGCVQTVRSDRVLGRSVVTRPGAPDFNPDRVLVPGPNGGFPPLASRPGAQAGLGYSPFVRIEGTDVVYNAPVVATGLGRFGRGRFDAVTHRDTHDRLLAIDTKAMTADMNFVRAFSHGKDIFYLSFESSSALTAVLDRSTFTPGLGLSPAPDRSRDPGQSRSAIFAFTNGQRGRTSPPAQGNDHVIADGLNAKDLNLRNADVLEALRVGGDAHNVLDSFPTLADPAMRALYSPIWDVNVGVWSDAAVASGLNVAQTDANRIRQLAVQGLVTSPGGTPLRSDRSILNCPALGFLTEAPQADQAPKPPEQP